MKEKATNQMMTPSNQRWGQQPYWVSNDLAAGRSRIMAARSSSSSSSSLTLYFPASGQTVVTGVVPSPPRFLPSVFIAHRVQQSRCSSTFHRVLLTHALALSASQFVHKKKSQRIYTSMHSAGLELTKLTYTRLEDNLIRIT